MKKFLVLAFCFSLVSTLYSCGRDLDSTNSGNIKNKNSNVTNGNVLIVYFSRAGENYSVGHISVGNTAKMAGYIQDYTGGTTYEIVPEVPYPDGYEKTKEVSQQETANNARPAIKNPLENLEKYSIIFIGSPIWYGKPPMIMRTFYEKYKEELKDKTLIPFGTHEGSGISSSTNLMKEYFPDAKLLESLGIMGHQVSNSRAGIEEWLVRIGIPKKEQK